jgi:uncharacterized protein (TIGR03083 family)
MDVQQTWKLIHSARGATADSLAELSPDQWASPSLCAGWSVQDTAGHIVVGGEQTPVRFMAGMASNLFRFNTMVDRQARKVGARPPAEIVDRLRATAETTNRPPAPVMAMLGEIVVHSEDIRNAVDLPAKADEEAVAACLELFSGANFPVGTKRRIAGCRLVATDVGWSHGTGPEVSGPGLSLLLAITGRAAGLEGLSGEGLPTLQHRMGTAA